MNDLQEILKLTARINVKKDIAKDLNLNLEDFNFILAFWQLKLYEDGNFISDDDIVAIKAQLSKISSTSNFARRKYFNVKSIQKRYFFLLLREVIEGI